MKPTFEDAHSLDRIPIEFYRRKLHLEIENARLLRVIRMLRMKLPRRRKRHMSSPR